LFQTFFGWKKDFAACSDYTVPRKPFGCLESPDHLAGSAWEAGGGGHFAISGDFAFGNAANGGVDLIEHLCGGSCATDSLTLAARQGRRGSGQD
jgi:hypothetical protein